MSDLASAKTLILNKDFNPIGVVGFKAAITLLYSGKVEVIHEYDDVHVRSVSVTIKLPSVLRLLKYVKWTKRMMGVRFNRVNVYRRDNYVCQYCQAKFAPEDLTFDHVIPRDLGGKTEWENIVTSCLRCNSRKANRTPKQAGLELLKAPFKPDWRAMKVTFGINKIPKSWADYIYWEVELDP